MSKNSRFTFSLYKKVSAPDFSEWCMIAVILFFCTITFMYGDVTCTMDNSILLLKAVKNGEFLQFYQYSIENANTVWAANYEILIYIIFSIWLIPVALIDSFFPQFNYLESIPALLWTKLLLILAAFGTAYLIYRICEEFHMKKQTRKFVLFIWISSLTLIVPVFVTSQIDIISLFFVVLGIYGYIKSNMKLFIGAFIIAIPLKLFALFVFIPLILLREKRILQIFISLLSAMSGLILCKILFASNDAYQIAVNSFSNAMIDTLQSVKFPSGISETPVFIAIYIGICIWCYYKKTEIVEIDLQYYSIYIPFLVMLSLFMFIPAYPYWFVLMSPYIAIIIGLNMNNMKINVLLETIGSIGMFLTSVLYCPWVYSCRTMEMLLMQKFFPMWVNSEREFNNIAELLDEYNLSRFMPAFMAVFLVCYGAFLLINCRNQQIDKAEENEKFEKGYLYVRFLPIILVIVLFFTCFFSKKATVYYDSLSGSVEVCSSNVLETDREFIQTLEFSETFDVSEIQLKFQNNNESHINMSSIILMVTDNENGNVLFTKRIACNSIKNAEKVCIKTDHLQFKKNTQYNLVLKGKDGKDEELYFYASFPEDMNETESYGETFAIRVLGRQAGK